MFRAHKFVEINYNFLKLMCIANFKLISRMSNPNQSLLRDNINSFSLRLCFKSASSIFNENINRDEIIFLEKFTTLIILKSQRFPLRHDC